MRSDYTGDADAMPTGVQLTTAPPFPPQPGLDFSAAALSDQWR
jgi:hypothetical protein